EEEFRIRVPAEQQDQVTQVVKDDHIRLSFPKGLMQESELEKSVQVILPENVSHRVEDSKLVAGEKVYFFPARSEVRSEAVDRWALALVIAQSVAMICLWGTLVGSMLPL